VQCFGGKDRREKYHWEDQGEDGRLELEWILGRLAGRMLSGCNWLRAWQGAGCCECGDKASDSDSRTYLIFVEYE
jgi:hypothetical protein